MKVAYHEQAARYADSPLHSAYLRRLYAQSYAQVQALGADPLAAPNARALLCGAASASTVAAFIEFVRGRCPTAQVTVLDLAQAPLSASRRRLGASLVAVRADATALPFADETFDLIEADFLLQFIAHEHKPLLFEEWHRVLAPGAAFMTRDYVVSPGNRIEAALEVARRAWFRRSLGLDLPGIEGPALSKALTDSRFEFTLERPRVGFGRAPLVGLLAGVHHRSAEVRETTEADWPEVRALIAQTPMSAALPLSFERGDSRARAYPRFNGESLDLVATREGRIVATLHGQIEERQILSGGSVRRARVVYAGDLRVRSGRQGRGLATELLRAFKARALARDVEFGFCLVNEGNDVMLRLLQSVPELQARVVRTFTTASRLLLRRPTSLRGVIERITPTRPQFEALAEQLSSRALAPHIDGAALQRLCEEFPELRFYRAGTGADPAFALWNMARTRRFTLQRWAGGPRAPARPTRSHRARAPRSA